MSRAQDHWDCALTLSLTTLPNRSGSVLPTVAEEETRDLHASSGPLGFWKETGISNPRRFQRGPG
jgi:hypothetical protein